jgi:integrase
MTKPLVLRRRHGTHCRGSHKPGTRNYESDERRKGWKCCDCPIYATGTLNGGANAKNTFQTTWDAAAKVQQKYELAGSWEADVNARQTPVILSAPAGETLEVAGITVEQAVRLYLQDARDRGNDPSTIAKKEFIFARTEVVEWRGQRKGEVRPSETVSLLGFCGLKGVRYLRDLTVSEIREWRSMWKDGATARRKKQGRVIGFFWFCERSGWLPPHTADNLTRGLGKIEGRMTPTGYFEPDHYAKLLDATYVYTDKAGYNGPIADGRRIRAVMETMRWGGLSIRDAVCLERSRLTNDPETGLPALMVQRSKKRDKDEGWIFVLLPPHVAEQLSNVPPGPKPNPRYFFWSGEGLQKSAVANWQRSFRRLFRIADLKLEDGKSKRCHPHMFRDTWAVESLLAGMDIRIAADVLGHKTVKTTEQHYMPWVRARQTHVNRAQIASMIKQGVLPSASAATNALSWIYA